MPIGYTSGGLGLDWNRRRGKIHVDMPLDFRTPVMPRTRSGRSLKRLQRARGKKGRR